MRKKMLLLLSGLLLSLSLTGTGNTGNAFAATDLNSAKLVDASTDKAITIDQGKPKLLVLFWATWCVTCKHKLKELLPEMSSKHPDLSIITINIDDKNQLGRVKNYMQKNEVKLPVYRDTSPPESDYIKTLGVKTAPHWAFYRLENKQWKLVQQEEAFDLDKINPLLTK